MKTWLVLLLILLSVNISSNSHSMEISEDSIRRMVLYLDLVAEGDIVSVNSIRLPSEEVFGNSNMGVYSIVTELQINIKNIIAGEYTGKELTAYLLEGRIGNEETMKGGNPVPDIVVGDHIIIGLHHNIRGNNRYFLVEDHLIFKVEGNNLLPYEEEYTVNIANPIHLMCSVAAQREYKHMIIKADYICVGLLKELNRDSGVAVFSILENIKGIFVSEELIVHYEHNVAIEFKKLNDTLLIFLSNDNGNYKLLDGINSVYLINNGRLIRNRTTLSTTLKQVKSEFQIYMEEER